MNELSCPDCGSRTITRALDAVRVEEVIEITNDGTLKVVELRITDIDGTEPSAQCSECGKNVTAEWMNQRDWVVGEPEIITNYESGTVYRRQE